jgi:hypothetical protein
MSDSERRGTKRALSPDAAAPPQKRHAPTLNAFGVLLHELFADRTSLVSVLARDIVDCIAQFFVARVYHISNPQRLALSRVVDVHSLIRASERSIYTVCVSSGGQLCVTIGEGANSTMRVFRNRQCNSWTDIALGSVCLVDCAVSAALSVYVVGDLLLSRFGAGVPTVQQRRNSPRDDRVMLSPDDALVLVFARKKTPCDVIIYDADSLQYLRRVNGWAPPQPIWGSFLDPLRLTDPRQRIFVTRSGLVRFFRESGLKFTLAEHGTGHGDELPTVRRVTVPHDFFEYGADDNVHRCAAAHDATHRLYMVEQGPGTAAMTRIVVYGEQGAVATIAVDDRCASHTPVAKLFVSGPDELALVCGCFHVAYFTVQ